MRDRGQQRKAAPENAAQSDDELARITDRQRPNKRRSHHVEDKECACQITKLRLRQLKLNLHQWLNRIQDRSVNVVDQVERGQHYQRSGGLELGLRHRSSEYSMAGLRRGECTISDPSSL